MSRNQLDLAGPLRLLGRQAERDALLAEAFDAATRLGDPGLITQARLITVEDMITDPEPDLDEARRIIEEASEAARLQIDSSWARQILSGTMSPIAALEQRLGRAAQVDAIRAAIADRPLARISSRVAAGGPSCHAEEPAAGAEAPALQSALQSI